MAKTKQPTEATEQPSAERREFLTSITAGFGVVGAACAAYPFIKSMEPSADVKAQATTTVDISAMKPGDHKVVAWQGKPVFIFYRTKEEIDDMQKVNVADLRDPETDHERVINPNYLVVVGICTHLGCVPMPGGKFEGWLCPCHGSQYDASGRVRKGPAPLNLHIPPYKFVDNNTILIGKKDKDQTIKFG